MKLLKKLKKELLGRVDYLLGRASSFGLQKYHYGGILIIGDKNFYERTISAMILIKNHDPINYIRVNKYIREIIESENVPSKLCLSKRAFFVDNSTLNHSLMWYASCLVHESVHSIIWNKKIHTNKMNIEKACIKVQIRNLIRLGEKINNPKQYLNEIMETKWWTRQEIRKELWRSLRKVVMSYNICKINLKRGNS